MGSLNSWTWVSDWKASRDTFFSQLFFQHWIFIWCFHLPSLEFTFSQKFESGYYKEYPHTHTFITASWGASWPRALKWVVLSLSFISECFRKSPHAQWLCSIPVLPQLPFYTLRRMVAGLCLVRPLSRFLRSSPSWSTPGFLTPPSPQPLLLP